MVMGKGRRSRGRRLFFNLLLFFRPLATPPTSPCAGLSSRRGPHLRRKCEVNRGVSGPLRAKRHAISRPMRGRGTPRYCSPGADVGKHVGGEGTRGKPSTGFAAPAPSRSPAQCPPAGRWPRLASCEPRPRGFTALRRRDRRCQLMRLPVKPSITWAFCGPR